MKQTILIAVAVAVIVGGASFYGGMQYGQSQSGAARRAAGANFAAGGQQPGTAGARQRGGFGGGGNFQGGQILSKDSNSITIKASDGSSKIVFLSSTTSIMKLGKGSLDDLVVGAEVTVNGTANSDGSMSAQSVQLRPTPTQPAPAQ